MWWIKASVTEYVLRSWSLVKMGTMAAQKKLFFSLRKAKRSLNIIDSQGLDEEQASVLGDKYGMSSSEIALMDQRITKRDLSLNTAVSNSEDEGLEFIDLLEDDSKSPEMLVSEAQENDIRNKYLLEAIEELTERERHIFEERRLSENPLTLEKLGEYYGISRERVRQLENRAFGKVEKAVRIAARGGV